MYMDKSKQNAVLKGLLVLIVILLVGYFSYTGGQKSGYESGYESGYAKAQADVKVAQDALAQKATEKAVNAANPFKTSANPLSGVTDPLAKTKNILNPFAK